MTFVDVTSTRYARPKREISDLCWRSHALEAQETKNRYRSLAMLARLFRYGQLPIGAGS
jgi:hypothetical protein